MSHSSDRFRPFDAWPFHDLVNCAVDAADRNYDDPTNNQILEAIEKYRGNLIGHSPKDARRIVMKSTRWSIDETTFERILYRSSLTTSCIKPYNIIDRKDSVEFTEKSLNLVSPLLLVGQHRFGWPRVLRRIELYHMQTIPKQNGEWFNELRAMLKSRFDIVAFCDGSVYIYTKRGVKRKRISEATLARSDVV